ncbi:MAG: hypothetical protein IJ099_03850 [Alphaproteobacteria bacterium]|nr:hypothetical protein [Alphaproteobacteria bacterium]
MKKNVIIYDGIARHVSLCDGVAQLNIEVNSQTLMMTDGVEMNKPQTSAVNTLIKIPIQGKALSCAVARELALMKVGHHILVTITEHVDGHKFYDILNMTICRKCL